MAELMKEPSSHISGAKVFEPSKLLPVNQTSLSAAAVIPPPAVAVRLLKPLKFDAQLGSSQTPPPVYGVSQDHADSAVAIASFVAAAVFACCAVCALFAACAIGHRDDTAQESESDAACAASKYGPYGTITSTVRPEPRICRCLLACVSISCA